MSVELLSPETEDQNSSTASALGATVFEKLAVDAEQAIAQPEGEQAFDFTNSVTRRGDGQTVPDER